MYEWIYGCLVNHMGLYIYTANIKETEEKKSESDMV
jgi:hypothetical protein